MVFDVYKNDNIPNELNELKFCYENLNYIKYIFRNLILKIVFREMKIQ